MSKPTVRHVDAGEFAHCTDDAVVVLEISRKEIEGCDFGSALERLHIMADTRENALRYRESLFLMVTGYDHDPRELCEIPEVRRYFALLCDQWPHWMWFLSRELAMVPLLMSFLCSVEVVRRPGAAGLQFVDRVELQTRLVDLHTRSTAFFATFSIEQEKVLASMDSAIATLGVTGSV